ncbi:MAG: CHAT domain-containing protein [Gloeotrichia echinulata GP01]
MNRLTPDWNAYIQFLREVLLATFDSNGDAKVVHQLLAQNIDKLDDNFAETLSCWATNSCAKAEPEAAVSVAGLIDTLSTLISQFPLGNTAVNLEIAITGYLVAFKIYTDTNFLQGRANTQNHLGIAYRNRIRGDKTENLEIAIAAYYDALIVRIRADFPQEWAMTQLNLGGAYIERIKGNKADNLEQAITALSNAMHVFTRKDFPQEWAVTQHNLGTAYDERIRGDKAENLEQSITALSNALEVHTCSDFPQAWADTQNNLGITFRHRIKGDKAENLEQAITAFKNALEVRPRSDFPQAWAKTQNNLGNAYIDRIKGDKAENLEKAITAFSNALQVFTRNNYPQAWADGQSNLGNAYRARIKGDKAQNLEQAIILYNTALEVRTHSDFPQAWAETQNNLGNAYTERIQGDQANNLEKAIAAFTNALKVRTRDDFEQTWAETQNNLGLAYANSYYIIERDKNDNLKKAIAAFTNALGVRTSTKFPEKYSETLFNLGVLYYNSDQYKLAESTFASAIKTVENLRDEIVSGEESRRKQSEKWNGLFICMVEVCLKLGRDTEAIEYVERSKTRNLVELILNRDLKTIFPPEVVTQLEQLRDEIANGQYQLQNGKAENPTVLAQHLQQLRQQRNELQDKYLPVGSGFKFDQFQKTLDQRTAIIEWYIASDRILAFVVKPNGQALILWQSQPEDLEALINWANEYLGDYDEYKQKTSVKWQNQLEERLKKLAQILHLEEILAQVPKECDRLILIPHRYLHLFPLHALPVGESYLLDLFPKGVGYAPSCQILQQVESRQRPDFQSLFAIQNPTEDLDYADLEVESILPLFSSHEVLSNRKATKAALTQAIPQLREVYCLHFSCHGSFDPNSPLDSCLVLANPDEKALDLNKCLTLGNLFERDFDLNQCRLVVLSACETGLIDFTNNSDEYIGLPSGFLYAGSVGVVNSLWTVDDLSTSFLMIKFFQNCQAALTANQDMSVASLIIKFFQKCQGALTANQDMSVASALKEAQLWLRNASKEELQQWTGKLLLDSTWRRNISRYFNKIEAGDKPFKSPYHWAAFTAVGK